MKILGSYIARAVIGSTIIVTLVFIAMESFIAFFQQLQDVGKGNYTIYDALIYVPLVLPSNVYQVFPMAGMIGSLLGLGGLASRSELIVMRAAGVAKRQIVAVVLLTAIVMLAVAIFFGEWLGPQAAVYAHHMKAIAMSGGQALQTRQGTWIRDGSNFIRIATVTDQDHLKNITRYEFNSRHQLLIAATAKTAEYINHHWIFYDVNESHISNEAVTAKFYKNQQWPVTFKPRVLQMTQTQASEQTLPKLLSYIHFLKRSGLATTSDVYNFWKRIFQPFATLVMILLAVPFIFGVLRHVTMGMRILVGVVAGMAFYLLNEFFGPFSMVFQIPPFAAAAVPTILFAVIGVVLLLKSR